LPTSALASTLRVPMNGQENKRVLLGMSGGVDSSVAGYLLREQGYDVVGVTMKVWPQDCISRAEDKCCGPQAIADARGVAHSLGIPHYVVDEVDQFERVVIDYFSSEYRAGRTPNPCVMCNEKLKFGSLWERARTLDCDFIATGHYAIIEHSVIAGINDPSHNLGGSRYLKVCNGLKIGPPPQVDLTHEIKVQSAVRDLIRAGLVKSAHDCSEGGLTIALAECCFNPERLFGAGIALNTGDTPAATVLFNESQSRIIISVTPGNLDEAESMLLERAVPFQQLGKVEGDQLRIQVDDKKFAWPVAHLFDDWWNSIRRVVESDSSAERIPSL